MREESTTIKAMFSMLRIHHQTVKKRENEIISPPKLSCCLLEHCTIDERPWRKQYSMAGATVPYALSEAVDVCKKRKSETHASTRDSPIDIVGVIVDLSYAREPFPIVCLWIQDPSLPSGVKALFSLRGSKALAFIQECDVSIGDIVRFNRVSLKEIETETTGGEDTVYHFHHSWTDPEAGPEWCRLGRLGDNINGSFTQDVLVIPDQMRTDEACLERLVAWYRESDYFSARGNQNPCLSQLPCQQRSLAQLQSMIGVVSNVVVKVTDFQNATPNYELGRKRRHSSISTPAAPCSFALLTDGVCSMPFLDDKSRFRTLLQQAVTTGRPLRLTRVSSRVGRSLGHVGTRIRKDALDEVVLVPTESTMAIFLQDGDAALWEPEESQVDPTQSQIPATPTHTPCQPSRNSGHHTILLSPIKDIVLLSGSKTNTSLAQVSEYPDASTRWASALVELGDTFSYRYCSTWVTLEAAVLSGKQQQVEAGGSIVRKLCGDLSVEELVSGEESFHRHAYNIMVSLYREGVPLRWTLEQAPEGTMYRVVDVSLHKLEIGNTSS
jgi:hypothetical protein